MLHAAIGGEKIFAERGGWGGELGLIAFREVPPSTFGLGSVNVFYHPNDDRETLRWDPFIAAGGTLAFTGRSGAVGLNYGGGFNRWGGGGFGIRVDFRHMPFRLGTDGFDLIVIRAGALFR
jgi:hypothetical protein